MAERVGIGIDLGGTSVKYALVTQSGKILKEGIRPSYAQSEVRIILENLASAAEEMKSFAERKGLSAEVVGIGTPGNVNIETGILMGSTPNFSAWRDVPISEEMQKLTGLPVFADNDGNLMALAEAKLGAGKGCKNLICITVGTGIGGGIILNGSLYRGSAYAGAELGHAVIDTEGIRCNCGSTGCLEMYASATAMIRRFSAYCRRDKIKQESRTPDAAYLFDLYKKGNTQAKQAIDESIYFLGRGLASFINIFNPEMIIVGGGVAEAGDLFLNGLRKITYQYAMEKPSENVRIEQALLGNRAGFLGAMTFAFGEMDKTVVPV
jgi:glucokinase